MEAEAVVAGESYKGLIAFDLDGTAIESHRDAMPSPDLVSVVSALQEENWYVATATSRPLPYCEKVIEALGLRGLNVVAGGAQVYDAGSRTDRPENVLLDEAGRLTELLRCIPYPCYIGETTFKPDEAVPTTEIDFSAGLSAIYFLGLEEQDAKDIKYSVEALHDTHKDPVRAVYIDSMLPGSDGLDVHVLSCDVSKGTGVQTIQRVAHIAFEDTIACGDGYNDLPLLQVAKRKVVMGNADPKLIQALQGDVLRIGSVHEDALSIYLKTLLE